MEDKLSRSPHKLQGGRIAQLKGPANRDPPEDVTRAAENAAKRAVMGNRSVVVEKDIEGAVAEVKRHC